MRRAADGWRWASLALAGFCLAASQDGIPEAKLKSLKAATPLIRRVATSGSSAGPGFVVHRSDDTCLVATGRRSSEAMPSFIAIQHPGTPEERKVPAQFVGEEPSLGLVLLKVTLPDPPEPLVPVASEPRETTPAFVLGFPLGENATAGAENPRVNVARGIVGSLRKNPKGELVRIQLDADPGPGTYGAPVLDRQGGLLGWMDSRVGDTHLTTAVPGLVLREILKGRAFQPDVKILDSKDSVRLLVSAPLHDPAGALEAVSLMTLRKDQAAAPPEDVLDAWSPVAPGMNETPLPIRGARAVGDVVLPLDAAAEPLFVFQVKQVRKDGKIRYSAPWDFNARPGAAPSGTAEPVAGGARKGRRPADDEWLGSDEERKQWAGGSVEVGVKEKTINVKRANLDGLEVITLPQEMMGHRGAGERAALSKDGRLLYYVGKEMVLVKVRVPEFIEERRVPIGKAVSEFGWTKEGLALKVVGADMFKSTPGEVWVFHPETLERTRQFPLTEVQQICFLPDQAQAILYHADRYRFLDMKTGSATKDSPLSKATKGTRWFDKPVSFFLAGLRVSNDGRYGYVAATGITAVPVRIDVKGGIFRVDEGGPPIGAIRFFFGQPDAKYAAVTAGNVSKVKGHPEMKGPGVVIYRATDLSKPTGLVPEITPICGGPASDQFWGLFKSGELALFDEQGKKVRGWFAFEPGYMPMEVTVAAEQGAFMMRDFQGQWTWVRWAKP